MNADEYLNITVNTYVCYKSLSTHNSTYNHSISQWQEKEICTTFYDFSIFLRSAHKEITITPVITASIKNTGCNEYFFHLSNLNSCHISYYEYLPQRTTFHTVRALRI